MVGRPVLIMEGDVKYKKYTSMRKEFKKDLRTAMSKNPALAMLAIETYCAYKHRRHIMQIWELFGTNI